jgi:hypothetical protein
MASGSAQICAGNMADGCNTYTAVVHVRMRMEQQEHERIQLLRACATVQVRCKHQAVRPVNQHMNVPKCCRQYCRAAPNTSTQCSSSSSSSSGGGGSARRATRLSAKVCELSGLIISKRVNHSSVAHDAWVTAQHAVHVLPHNDFAQAKCGAEEGGGEVAAAAAQRRDGACTWQGMGMLHGDE